MTADIGGDKLDITAELPTRFEDDSKRLTITIQDQLGGDVGDVAVHLGVVHSGELILEETFLAPDGRLAMDITTTPAGDLQISAERRSGMILAGPEGIRVSGPVFGAGGLYTLQIRIESVGGEPVANPQTHLADLLVADSMSHDAVDAEGGSVTFTTKSYFDRITAFRYDADAGIITFGMPFDWSESRVSHIPVIHEEVHFPKEFEEFVTRGYLGTANGVELFRSSVTVDDFTTEGDRTVHFVLLQDHLRLIKAQMDRPGGSLPDHLTFTLQKTQDIRSQMSAFTRNEEFQVDMTWEPEEMYKFRSNSYLCLTGYHRQILSGVFAYGIQFDLNLYEEILPGQKTKFIFTIRDANTGETLRNSGYDFVLKQDDREIYRSSGVAVVGGDFVEYEFSEEQAGTATALIENIRGTGQHAAFVFVVVPEFGAVAILVLVASVAAAALSRRTILRY